MYYTLLLKQIPIYYTSKTKKVRIGKNSTKFAKKFPLKT